MIQNAGNMITQESRSVLPLHTSPFSGISTGSCRTALVLVLPLSSHLSRWEEVVFSLVLVILRKAAFFFGVSSWRYLLQKVFFWESCD